MSFWQAISDLVKRPRAAGPPAPAETERRPQEAALQPGQLIGALLAGVNEAVLVVDPELRVRLCNEQALNFFGLPNRSHPLRLVNVTRNQTIHTLVRQTLEQGAPCEGRVQILTGHERTLHVRVTPIAVPGDGAVLGVVASFQDLTHLERLERVRREFFANLSHDIRTPLTSIIAYVETLLDGALADPDNNVRFLETIHKNAIRLSGLINDYSNLSLIESGELKLQLTPIPLTDLVGDLATMVEGQLQATQVRLQVHIPAGLMVRADSHRLGQILTNLLDNAIKFNRPGGLVTLEAATEGRHSVITVRDTGVGIPPQDLPRIFERLYRVDKSRTPGVGGSGLGLSIVKHLVQAHGGEVSVESTPNVGSVFRVKLPAAE